MSELYDNLLKATNNIDDITTEEYGTITKIENGLCSVKELNSELEHTNVPILNGLSLAVGANVVLGFAENSIYNVFVIGTVGEKNIYSKKEIDKIVDDIEKGEIHIEDYDPKFTCSFGLSGVNDTITVHTFLEKINNGE